MISFDDKPPQSDINRLVFRAANRTRHITHFCNNAARRSTANIVSVDAQNRRVATVTNRFAIAINLTDRRITAVTHRSAIAVDASARRIAAVANGFAVAIHRELRKSECAKKHRYKKN